APSREPPRISLLNLGPDKAKPAISCQSDFLDFLWIQLAMKQPAVDRQAFTFFATQRQVFLMRRQGQRGQTLAVRTIARPVVISRMHHHAGPDWVELD